jgi:hypothetical protein
VPYGWSIRVARVKSPTLYTVPGKLRKNSNGDTLVLRFIIKMDKRPTQLAEIDMVIYEW